MFLLALFIYCAIINIQSDAAFNLILCKPGDNVCVTKSLRDAFPLVLEQNSAIGAEDLTTVDSMDQEFFEASLSTYNFKLFNTKITGYKTCVIESAVWNNETDEIHVEFLCSHFSLQGQYEVNQSTQGDFLIDTKKYCLTVEFQLGNIFQNGKKFKILESFALKADPLEKVSFNFKGNTDLDGYANENWKEAANQLEQVFATGYKSVVDNSNKYLKALSYDEYIRP